MIAGKSPLPGEPFPCHAHYLLYSGEEELRAWCFMAQGRKLETLPFILQEPSTFS